MKGRTYILMANLLAEELKNSGGEVVLDLSGTKKKYKVPTYIYDAITGYPSYFRAGAVGPDFFPDMLFGRTLIHPAESGRWLEYMFGILARYTPNSVEYYQALAFYLGFTLHYAASMWINRNICSFSNGAFPPFALFAAELFSPGGEKEGVDVSAAVRHIVIEAYMDGKTSGEEDFSLDIPMDYLRSCFTTAEAVRFRISLNSESSDEPWKFGVINAFAEILASTCEAAIKNPDGAEVARKRDLCISEWITESLIFARETVSIGILGAVEKCSDSFLEIILRFIAAGNRFDGDAGIICDAGSFFDEHSFPQMKEALEAAGRGMKKSAVRGMLLKPLKNLAEAFAGKSLPGVKNPDAALKFIGNCLNNPVQTLDGERLFGEQNKKTAEVFSTDLCFRDYVKSQRSGLGKLFGGKPGFSQYLDYTFGNLGVSRNPQGQTYRSFSNALNFGRLCLMGTSNLNAILSSYSRTGFRFNPARINYAVHKLRVSLVAAGECAVNWNCLLFRMTTRNGRYDYPLGAFSEPGCEQGYSREFVLYLDGPVFIGDIAGCDIVLSGGEATEIEFAKIVDADSGALISTSQDLKFENPGDSVRLSMNRLITQDIEDFVNDSVPFLPAEFSGFYGYFEADGIGKNKITLTITTKTGQTVSDTVQVLCDRKQRTVATRFAVSVKRKDIASAVITSLSPFDCKRVFLYEDKSFILVARNAGVRVGQKGAMVPFNVSYEKNYLEKGRNNWEVSRVAAVVCTSDEAKAGTSDDIFLGIWKNAESGLAYFQLSSGGTDFKQGQTDAFCFEAAEPFNINRIFSMSVVKNRRKFHLSTSANDWLYSFIAVVDGDSGVTLSYHRGDSNWLKGNTTVEWNDGYFRKPLQ